MASPVILPVLIEIRKDVQRAMELKVPTLVKIGMDGQKATLASEMNPRTMEVEINKQMRTSVSTDRNSRKDPE
jgi:hypothetical protein